MKLAFIEPSINNIYLNQTRHLSAYRDLDIYYISKDASHAKIKGITFIEPKTINILTRIIHFPTYAFLRFVSEKHKRYYLEFPEAHYYVHLSKILKSIKPDIIISNLYYRPYSWQAGFFAKLNNIPFILQTEIKAFPKNRLDKILTHISFLVLRPFLFSNARYIISWTKDGELFARKYLKEKNVELIPPCIDTAIFKPKKKRNKRINILMVGRFVGCKGYLDLVNALRLVDFPYQLNILGSGPLKDEIKNAIKKYNIKARFLGGVRYEEMPAVYNKNDFLVLPSHNEAIGMVVPEAMACGLPVVISDTVGAKTYVENGMNGFIFRTLDVKDLAEKITLMSKNFKGMGKNAAKTIQNKFSCKVLSERFYNLLKSV